MNLKKIAASLTAMLCCGSIVGTMPEFLDETYAAELVYNDFEVTYEGWYSNADTANLTADAGTGVNGSRGMTITDRTSPEDGVSSSKGFYLSGGKEYNYSVQVYSKTDEVFHVSLLCKDEDTDEETLVELASKAVRAGEWTEISTKYTAPANSYEFKLTINTESTNDFSFDNVLITERKSKNAANAAPAGKGLKDEFANYGFRVGNILNGGTVKNSAITAIMLKDHNAIECENETKPDATLVQNGSTNTNVKVSLNSCAAIADFCVKNNIGFRGHTLVWHSQTPEWFFKENFNASGSWVSSSVMDQRLESYIKNMFNAFATQYPTLDLYAYDVCNECVSDDGNRTANNGGAREPGYGNGKSPWVQVYGSNAFIEKAFTYARKYAPSTCKLYYNDYNEYWDHKRDCIINTIIKPLYNKKLLDGMGMQSHVPANATGFAGTDSYIEAMDKYLSIGCDLQISELDISLEDGKYSYTDQANKYKAIFQHAIDVNKSGKYNGKVTLVQVWGPNDGNSWLKAGSNALLYDANNNPKEAYKTLTAMIPDSEWGDGSNVGNTPVTPPEPNEYGWWYQCGFENGDDNWTNRGGNKVAQSDAEHYTEWGSHSLYVSDRTSAWMGASLALNSRIFEAGKSYSFSAHVKQKTEENVKFMMKIEYTDGSGETAYDEVANVIAPKDTWAQLANENYKIPSDASNIKIYIETEDSLTDFYIDEAIGAVDGTPIKGEGQPTVKIVTLGDVNFDGVINVFDVAAARKYIVSGITDAQTKKAADVDRNGKFEAADLVLIHQYVMGRITEFPKAQISIDTEKMEAIFNSVNPLDSWKKDGENNVLWTQRFGADPGFMVYKDRLYVYTTNDAVEYKNDGSIQTNSYNSGTINCFSSADLVNWTDHGAIPVAARNSRTTNGAAKWASFAWAPDACWKTINGKDKFFLYFADSAGGIGVLTADSPEGPYVDPIGKALVNHQSPNCSDVCWMFDPGVFVDDDGTGYLYFGGGVDNRDKEHPKTGRCVKLGDDMISLGGTPVTMDTPYLFEDSSILKIGKTYYYSYCTNWNVAGGNPYGFNSGEIAYMTSDNPLGPFTYRGVALKNPAAYQLDGGGNNHHSIVEFKGKHYVLYHSRHLSRAMNIQAKDNNGNLDLGGNYRSTHIDQATVGADGKISCTGTMKGVSQIEALNPYAKIQAETMSNQSKNLKVNGLYDTTVAVGKGDWFKTSGADFGSGASSLTMRASSKSGAVIKVCAGSAKGSAIAYVEIPAGGSMEEIEVPVVDSVTGGKDLYFVASGDAEVDWWQFAE